MEEKDKVSVHYPYKSDCPSLLEQDRPGLTLRKEAARSSLHGLVPLAQRRGLLGCLMIIPERENPYEYTITTKWLITFIVSLAAAASQMGSSIFYRESCACNGVSELTRCPYSCPP